MNILVLGSGGREHTIAHQLHLSPKADQIFVAPGNAGTQQIATNVEVDLTDFEAIADIIKRNNIKMLVVGPEAPLVDGITDYFNAKPNFKDLMIIGPSKKGAELEGSKKRAKEFMKSHNIPTAAYQSFTSETLTQGFNFLESLQPPYVLKADGLAGGKGVLILDNLKEAKQELSNMLTNQKFGSASQKVVIEEFLNGIELSVFVLTDGKDYAILPNAKDYKRIGEGDTGLNTGGMGAVSPVPFADEVFMKKVEDKIIKPTINGLAKEEIDYKGFVFIGLMKVEDEPYVIEYNVRMGDPETEVVLPRIKTDLVDALTKTATSQLNSLHLDIDEQSATTVMLVSGGYPEAYNKGEEILGLETINNQDIFICHAGTTEKNSKTLTNGGRVIAVTAFDLNFKNALKKAYNSIDKISFKNKYYRTDIGKDLA
mgnify:CR=1 FL=1